MSKWVIFTLRMPGFHRWEDAPVRWGYLSNWHRHEFHIRCEIKVNKNRQIEIIDQKESLHQMLLDDLPLHNAAGGLAEEAPFDFYNHICLNQEEGGDGSCEMLVNKIATWMSVMHETSVIVTVLEDGENGARVEA